MEPKRQSVLRNSKSWRGKKIKCWRNQEHRLRIQHHHAISQCCREEGKTPKSELD